MSEAPSTKKIHPPRVTVLFSLAADSPRLAQATAPPAGETAPARLQPLHVPPADRKVPSEVHEVARALSGQGFAVSVVNIVDEPERLMNSVTVEEPDLAFNMVSELEGTILNDHLVPSLLDWMGVPYSGSEPQSLSTCLDRTRTRIILHDAGIPVPKFAIVRDVNAVPDTPGFRRPMIVTQAYDDVYETEGAQHPLYDWESVAERSTELAAEYALPLLIEEYVGYRRLHVIVLGNRTLELLPIVETDMPEIHSQPPSDEAQDYAQSDEAQDHAQSDEANDHAQSDEANEDDETTERKVAVAGGWPPAPAPGLVAVSQHSRDPQAAPAVSGAANADTEPAVRATAPTPLELGSIYLGQMEPDQADRVRNLATRAFRAVGCRDLAMIDVHLDEKGNAYVTDVRPVFEMNHGHVFALAADTSDRGYDRTIAEIARIALRRSGLPETALLSEKLAESLNAADAPVPTPPPAEAPIAAPPSLGPPD